MGCSPCRQAGTVYVENFTGRKFSPMHAIGENFSAKFLQWNFWHTNFFLHVEILHVFSHTQSAVLTVTDIQNLSFFFSIFNLHVTCPNLDVATVIFPSCTLRPARSCGALINRAVAFCHHCVQQQAKAKETKKWGTYIKLDEKTKIRIGKYSSENRMSTAARYLLIELGIQAGRGSMRL